MELMVGSLLGDATLLRTTAGYCFRVHHGIAQSALVNWKYERLRDFVRSSPRISGRGIYFRTVTHRALTPVRIAFYRGQKKIVPVDLLRRYLTPLALAVWIMDDGSADGKALRINTQSFDFRDVCNVAILLEQIFDLKSTLNYDKGMPRLRFDVRNTRRLSDLVRPHLIPEMRYKLPS